jgi:hypothetical protein
MTLDLGSVVQLLQLVDIGLLGADVLFFKADVSWLHALGDQGVVLAVVGLELLGLQMVVD